MLVLNLITDPDAFTAKDAFVHIPIDAGMRSVRFGGRILFYKP
jgi:hypothetical protein